MHSVYEIIVLKFQFRFLTASFKSVIYFICDVALGLDWYIYIYIYGFVLSFIWLSICLSGFVEGFVFEPHTLSLSC